ncbi:DUF2127 domain-containing protein [Clostridium pasteurianum]|uniref:Putative membrane protein n=1 Tax=Clostridium pasteurianum BC1 TaxID=86416 RepID=R4K3X1_CLOPA|nr:DUF2127 domain-containing protein [Clostridium pasteurianum]AGK97832.1 putative membrane protein [Clostridium pasteurianum BC1]
MMLNNKLLESKKINEKNNIFHQSFEIGILLKGIDGILEIIGGILLVFLNPHRLNRIVVLLTQDELSENPRDTIANFIVKSSLGFNLSFQHFAIFYLISHGAIKLILVILLWKKKMFAYPLTIFSLTVFIIYQLYRYTQKHSALLIGLTIFDIIMIVLTFIEYKNIKNKGYEEVSEN